jgi:hypothetical protein
VSFLALTTAERFVKSVCGWHDGGFPARFVALFDHWKVGTSDLAHYRNSVEGPRLCSACRFHCATGSLSKYLGMLCRVQVHSVIYIPLKSHPRVVSNDGNCNK